MLNNLKKETLSGKKINFSNILKCHNTYCDHPQFIKGDKISCFKNCFHLFHSSCLDLMTINYGEGESYVNIPDEGECLSEGESEGKTDDEIEIYKSTVGKVKECKICSKL
jgi:hypothetical protein